MMMADYSNRTLLGTAKKMWRSGGFLGLWRGNLVSVVKVVPQSAIQYAVGLMPLRKYVELHPKDISLHWGPRLTQLLT